MLPGYQGGFAYNQMGFFQLTVTNIGQAGSDTYDLTSVSNSQDWTVTFYSSDGKTPLADTDQNGTVDTGVLAQGEGARFCCQIAGLHPRWMSVRQWEWR
jgi:hypothetical protein